MGFLMDYLAGYVIPAVIAILTPIVLAGIKAGVAYMRQRLPKQAYPTVAPVLGAILEMISGVDAIPGLPPGVGGAVLGAVGNWLREFYDQWRQALDPRYSAKVSM